MKKQQGVYLIRNLTNDMVYVGQACANKGIARRFIEHRSALNKNKHFNQHLQNAWNKYGENNFRFEIVESVELIDLLDSREQFWLDTYRNTCYNIQLTAGGSNRGVKKVLSEEAKKNIAVANKQRVWTPEIRKQLSKMRKGVKFSKETAAKSAMSRTGLKQSIETRKKKSLRLKGRKFSPETIEKIRKSKLGIEPSQEAINKRLLTLRLKPPRHGSYKGVSKRKNSWRARAKRPNGKIVHLGTYPTGEKAAVAYNNFMTAWYGEACYLNFIA